MNKRAIKEVFARQVDTWRGHPGVEAIVRTEGGAEGRAVCQSGISIGTHEIAFQMDGGDKWGGKGVTKAAANVREFIEPAIKGMDCANQAEIDNAILNIMPNAKEKIGGNAVGAASAAVLQAGAKALGIPLYQHIGGASAMYLPVAGEPAFGGHDRYGGGVTTPGYKPTISFMFYDFPTFSEAAYAAYEVKQYWAEELSKLYYAIPNNYDMYIVPPGVVKSDEALYELMAKCIDKAGHRDKVGIQMDCATDTYYDREKKVYRGNYDSQVRDRDQMLDFYKHIVKTYPFVILEDPFYEDDYESHALLTKEVDIQIVGDDLFTTDTRRVEEGAKIGAANCVLLKVYQIGTITETLEMIRYAYQCGYGIMPCESRGEGPSIADYCVGIGAGTVREQIRGEAGNRFLDIERELGARARFWGKKGIKGRRFQGEGNL